MLEDSVLPTVFLTFVSVNGNNDNSANAATPIRPTGNYEVDHRNLLASLENNPNVPRNCTITRPPPITKPGRLVVFVL